MSQSTTGRVPAVAAWESHDTEGRRCVLTMLREEADEAERRGSAVFASAARVAIRVLQRPETITEKDLSQAEHAAAVAACEADIKPPDVGAAAESAAAALQTDAERARFLDWCRDHWCLECGTNNPRCQCWNDE